MGTTYSLRPATTEDISMILKIETQVHTAPWTEQNFRAELEKPYSQFLLLTDDETDSEVVGYVVFWVLFDECQILNLAVGLSYRGLGLGKFMVQKIIGFAERKSVKRVVLDVRKSNLPAIHLYQASRFVITSIRKSFYSDGEDAYQMTLSLEADPIPF